MGGGIAGKAQGDFGAAALKRSESHVAAVLLDDLVDDGETKAGALLPCGHIGFDDALAVIGQADAIVGNCHCDHFALTPHCHTDFAAIIIAVRF